MLNDLFTVQKYWQELPVKTIEVSGKHDHDQLLFPAGREAGYLSQSFKI